MMGCATTPPPVVTIETIQNLPDPTKGISQVENNLKITLYPVEADLPERKEFYKGFTKKGFLPLQISIQNPMDHAYSLEKVQYAICDPDFNRIRRISPKNMAIMDSEIIYEREGKRGLLSGLQKRSTAKKITKEYQKSEFQSSEIPPHATMHGWLYFQVKEGEFEPSEFFEEIQGYQLEIAHVKDLGTNIVNNFYFDLDQLAGK